MFYQDINLSADPRRSNDDVSASLPLLTSSPPLFGHFLQILIKSHSQVRIKGPLPDPCEQSTLWRPMPGHTQM